MNKEKIVGLAVLTLILTAGISTAFADSEDWGARKGFSEEHQAQMTEVFENGNYGDWIAFADQRFEERTGLGEERYTERMAQMTEENFAQFAEAHELRQAGDFEGAQAIMEDLGIERGFGSKGNGLKDGSQRGVRGQGQRLSQNQ
ncbi:MAG: hypothetical protein KAJ58_02115 [Candidatus Pacebacteria bacterium]|nr:hypothetical protein [Candidatus Paceibacterota bacterium]